MPAGTRALPEKRFGGKGHSAVVGATKRARLVIKKRKERRRGRRKRLGKMMRMSSRCSSDRAEFRRQLVVFDYVRSTRRRLAIAIKGKVFSITHS